MSIRQIIVSSLVKQPFHVERIASVLLPAIQRNAEAGIHSYLLHGNGVLLQIIEGPSDHVEDLLERLSRDPRHEELRVLYDEAAEKPEFDMWYMGFKDLDLCCYRSLYESHCQAPSFERMQSLDDLRKIMRTVRETDSGLQDLNDVGHQIKMLLKDFLLEATTSK